MSRTKLRALLGYLLMLVACLIPIYCFGQMVLQSLGQVKGHATFVKSMTTEMYQEQQNHSLAYNQRLASPKSHCRSFFGGGI